MARMPEYVKMCRELIRVHIGNLESAWNNIHNPDLEDHGRLPAYFVDNYRYALSALLTVYMRFDNGKDELFYEGWKIYEETQLQDWLRKDTIDPSELKSRKRRAARHG